LIKNKLYILIVIILFAPSLYPGFGEDVLNEAKKLYPERRIHADSLNFSDMPLFVQKLLDDSEYLNGQLFYTASERLRGNSEISAGVPNLSLSIGENAYQMFNRLATIEGLIPVEWDNDNPIQVDINLPNGGRGYLWMPKPTRYEYQTIQFHASNESSDQTAFATFGLNHDMPFGVSLNLMNLSLYYKPLRNYGYPYSSALTNGVSISVWELLSPSKRRSNAGDALVENSVFTQRLLYEKEFASHCLMGLSDFLMLGYLSESGKILYQEDSLSQIQLADMDILYKKGIISTTDQISVLSGYDRLLSQRQGQIYDFLRLNRRLNKKDDVLKLWFPSVGSMDSIITRLESGLKGVFMPESIEHFSGNNPDIKIANSSLKTEKIVFASSELALLPDFSIAGSISMYESDNVGYESVTKAIEKVYQNPDGFSWTVSANLSYPVSNRSGRLAVQSQRELVRSREFMLSHAKEEYYKTADGFLISLNAKREKATLAKLNLERERTSLDDAGRLYSTSRITRFSYISYQKRFLELEVQSLQAEMELLSLLFEIYTFFGIPERIFE
jgi:hypothetical protein